MAEKHKNHEKKSEGKNEKKREVSDKKNENENFKKMRKISNEVIQIK